eukprot:8370568-Alexandrium_andersonii.AAC.1
MGGITGGQTNRFTEKRGLVTGDLRKNVDFVTASYAGGLAGPGQDLGWPGQEAGGQGTCLLYTSPSPRD